MWAIRQFNRVELDHQNKASLLKYESKNTQTLCSSACAGCVIGRCSLTSSWYHICNIYGEENGRNLRKSKRGGNRGPTGCQRTSRCRQTSGVWLLSTLETCKDDTVTQEAKLRHTIHTGGSREINTLTQGERKTGGEAESPGGWRFRSKTSGMGRWQPG